MNNKNSNSKYIVVINGSGGVGKDTFVELLKRYISVEHISVADPAKQAARDCGWTGHKSEEDRKFLSDLKSLVDGYNNYCFKYVCSHINLFKFTDNFLPKMLCIDMREPKQINELRERYSDTITVLVKRDSVKQVTSNKADAGVYDMEYDFVIDNNGSTEDLAKEAKRLVESLTKEAVKD